MRQSDITGDTELVARKYPAAKSAAKTKARQASKAEPEPESFVQTRMTLRFDSAEQKQYIAAEARRNRRTMNDEILYRLFPNTD